MEFFTFISEMLLVHLSYLGASHKFRNAIFSFQSDSKEAISNHDLKNLFMIS